MEKIESCVLTNMCMIYDHHGNILVQDRLNPNWPGLTFPGGHIEKEESFVKSTIREIKEETGLDINDLQLCGIKQFTHRQNDYRYIVLFYKTNHFTGTLSSSKEGEVFWIKREDITKYHVADGFLEILEIFENDTLSENFHWFDGEWKEVNL